LRDWYYGSNEIKLSILNNIRDRKKVMTDKLYVQKLREEAILPTRGSAEAAGLDLYAVGDHDLKVNERKVIPTGIALATPRGTYVRIAPRSGLALKHGVDVLAGVVDSDYRGQIGVVLINLGNETFNVKHGDRVAQAIVEVILMPEVVEVEDLESTDRGSAGYGSTGV
jgi:dUTP pyrophosphatase